MLNGHRLLRAPAATHGEVSVCVCVCVCVRSGEWGVGVCMAISDPRGPYMSVSCCLGHKDDQG